jgi:hypothetical protein
VIHSSLTSLLSLSSAKKCRAYILASHAGLCTNIACPYRHVKVNLNAPVCEDFLKGYCAYGDEVCDAITRYLLIFIKFPLAESQNNVDACSVSYILAKGGIQHQVHKKLFSAIGCSYIPSIK